MCMSAIIWANIETVYYGNTKEDADRIGFRDDFIYNYLKKITKNKSDDKVLKLKSLNRKAAIKTFETFEKQKNKNMY